MTVTHSPAQRWLLTLTDESVDLIATDPPYNTGRDFDAYDDRWDSASDYIGEKRAVAVELHRVLKPTGSLYLQCDWHSDAYLRLMLDEVFGIANFRNAIYWVRNTALMANQFSPRRYSTHTDTILFYAKSEAARVKPYKVLTLDEQVNKYPHVADDGRRYNWDGKMTLVGFHNIARDRSKFEWRGHKPANGWRMTRENLDAEFASGDIIDDNGTLRRRNYMRPEGDLIGNLWDDIKPALGNKRVGYPTQKPIDLYERIIDASSAPGDLVIDPFAGSGTTLIAAKRLGRRFAGCDISSEAVELANRRLTEILL